MDYLIAKWIHILSSTFLFGTGVGSAFYLFAVVLLREDVRTVATLARLVVIADVLFTATTAVIQPLTGFYLVHRAGMDWGARWIVLSIVLYTVAIGCWLIVVFVQIRMRDLAAAAVAAGAPLPARFHHWFRVWVLLGIPALLAFLLIFWLMIAKPA